MTHDNKKMNNNLFRRPLIHLACPMLLAIVAVVVAAAAAAVPSVEAVFHTLPLVPHHVQQARRRHLLLSSASDSNNDDPLTFNSTTTTITTGIPIRRSRMTSYGDRHLRAQQIGALFQGYGTHYIDLWCGTNPPQRQTVIVDTGSAVTAFPCSGCRSLCGKDYHIDQVFDEAISPTFKTLDCNECMRGRCGAVSGTPQENTNACKIGMSYQEGSSWTAFEARDYCYVGGPHGKPLDVLVGDDKNVPAEPKEDLDTNGESTADIDPQLASTHAFPLVFGCQTKLTGLFKTQLADGIMGMDNAKESFWHQMSAAGKMNEEIFTLCFGRQPTADRRGTEAGAMTLGGVDTRLHTSPIVYAEVNVNNYFYGIHVRNVYLRAGGGGDSALSTNPDLQVKRVDISEADLNRGTTIVDSGTTDTYFTRNIAGAFKKLWKEMTGDDYSNNPVSLNKDQLDALPTILFQIKGLQDENTKLVKESSERVPGLVGALDPKNPYDLLWAVPPSHYMEYDDDMKKYVPRFYTDEGSGSVLGANVMMGHDIVFDQANGRLGVAESHCDYADLVSSNGFDWNPHETYNKVDHTVAPDADSEKEAEETNEAEKVAEKSDEDDIRKANKGTSESMGGESTDGFCDNTTCKGSIVLVIVACIAGVVIRKMTKKATISYSTELELQTTAADEDFGEGYRDEAGSDDDEFQDEQVE